MKNETVKIIKKSKMLSTGIFYNKKLNKVFVLYNDDNIDFNEDVKNVMLTNIQSIKENVHKNPQICFVFVYCKKYLLNPVEEKIIQWVESLDVKTCSMYLPNGVEFYGLKKSMLINLPQKVYETVDSYSFDTRYGGFPFTEKLNPMSTVPYPHFFDDEGNMEPVRFLAQILLNQRMVYIFLNTEENLIGELILYADNVYSPEPVTFKNILVKDVPVWSEEAYVLETFISGKEPQWIQSDETPVGHIMIAKIDSGSNNTQHNFGDDGSVYVFWDKKLSVQTIWQNY